MHPLRSTFFDAVILAASLCFTNAQSTNSPSWDDLQIIEATTPIPAASLPDAGTFWSAQFPPDSPDGWPPLPGNPLGLDAWPLGDGIYLLNDTNIDYAEIAAEAHSMSGSSMMSMMSSSLSTAYAYGNPVYLTNMAAIPDSLGNIIASFNIVGGTNFVPYDILSTTNLADSVSAWNWMGIGYTSNSYTFSNQSPDQAFYVLAKPSKTMAVPWGQDADGQCDIPLGITNAVQVVGGIEFSLALLTDGSVRGWGFNGAPESELVPTNLGTATMIASGWMHNVALLTNGTVTAWGDDLFHEVDVPPGLTNVTVISAGGLHSLALSSNGTVAAWGFNGSGETNVPSGLANVTAIAAGGEHNLAVSNGFVVAWGSNNHGQRNVPAGLNNVWDVAASGVHSLALKTDGTVVAWGDNSLGETNVPAGLSNVVAVAAGGDFFLVNHALPYSLALKSDGSIVSWGAGGVLNPVQGMSNVISLGSGVYHALAIRTGPPTPVLTLEPVDQYALLNSNATFTSRGSGLYGVTYQWQSNSVDIPGATNATLTLTNLQSGQFGSYDVVITDNGGMGSVVSSNADLNQVTVPVITSQSPLPTNQNVIFPTNVTLRVTAAGVGQTNGFPVSYQWQFAGTNIPGATSSNYTFSATNSGTYSLIVSNAAGTTTASWLVNVFLPGSAIGWGSNTNGQLNSSPFLTNIISLAAGEAQSLAALENGAVTNWGSYWTGTNFISVTAPPALTNAIAVAAGSRHDLALLANGSVIAWGLNDFLQTNVPPNVTNATAIAAGGQQSMALTAGGIVVQWGQINGITPLNVSNVSAIAAGTNFCLALLSNTTVAAWGDDTYGQTNVPPGLSNVVSIAAGGAHALALEQNGTVIAWGDNGAGETNVPVGLSNVMGVAAGDGHSLALLNNGLVVAWGDNTFGETNIISRLSPVKLIAGGGGFSLASEFSTFTMYPVDVTKDLLLIYNTNSSDSSTLCAYYLTNRPMVSGANVLGIGCDVGEFTTSNNCDAQIVLPVLNWLTHNPTKHPEYIVLFYDIPTRLSNSYPYELYGSTCYHLQNSLTGTPVTVNNINAASLADCEAYVDKLAYIGTNYSPNKLMISASAGGYGNTNYVLDGIRYGGPSPLDNYSGFGFVVSSAMDALLAAGISASNVIFDDGLDILSNNVVQCVPQLTSGANIGGYISWGEHSCLGDYYSTNRTVIWSGKSAWWIIETIESFNGQNSQTSPMGSFTQWFSSIAFGGTNYSNTPVGAVTHVEEPGGAWENPTVYFGLWGSGKNLAISAWNSRNTTYFQVVGDPLVVK